MNSFWEKIKITKILTYIFSFLPTTSLQYSGNTNQLFFFFIFFSFFRNDSLFSPQKNYPISFFSFFPIFSSKYRAVYPPNIPDKRTHKMSLLYESRVTAIAARQWQGGNHLVNRRRNDPILCRNYLKKNDPVPK